MGKTVVQQIAKYKMFKEYGLAMKEKSFCLRKGSIIVNQGFGMVPRRVQNFQKSLIDVMDSHPDDWFRRKSYGLWVEARNAIADFVNADHDDLVFVQNTTTAINSILKSYRFSPNDSILSTDSTFCTISKACQDVASKIPGGQSHILKIRFPVLSPKSIIDMYDMFLSHHPEVRFAVIDHISSSTAIKQPVEEIIEVCKSHNVLTIIDGAHAPGQLKLDIKGLNADFYTGDLHKWGFAPRGCSIMHVNKIHQEWVRPLVTSRYYGTGMVDEFFLQGCHDNIPYICVPEALRFFNDIGGIDDIVEYNSDLIEKASTYLASAWFTHKLRIPKSMEAPCMRLVKLPQLRGYRNTPEDAERFEHHVYKEHDIQFRSFCVDGDLYVRICAQVYNEFHDYQKLCEVVNGMRGH